METWQQQMQERHARHEARMAEIDGYLADADARLAASLKLWERSTALLDAKMVRVNEQNQAIAEGMEVLGVAVGVLIERSHSHDGEGV